MRIGIALYSTMRLMASRSELEFPLVRKGKESWVIIGTVARINVLGALFIMLLEAPVDILHVSSGR